MIASHTAQLREQWLQVALHELSKCLPEAQRPMPAHLVEVADNNTSALPNTGMDAGLPSCLCSQYLSVHQTCLTRVYITKCLYMSALHGVAAQGCWLPIHRLVGLSVIHFT